jgi:hypothetical protein
MAGDKGKCKWHENGVRVKGWRMGVGLKDGEKGRVKRKGGRRGRVKSGRKGLG